MCDFSTLVPILADIARNTDDKYEAGGIFTIGGPTGNYLLRSPFNTECEWALVAATVSAGSGIIVVSATNPSLSNMTTAAPTVGSSGGADNTAFEGMILPLSTTQNYLPFENWQPLGRGVNINMAVTMAGGNAYGVFAFRRLSERKIPRLANVKPHTHTTLSTRRQRTFYAGMDEAGYGMKTGAVINPKPNEDTSTSIGHIAAGNNPMAALDRRLKHG